MPDSRKYFNFRDFVNELLTLRQYQIFLLTSILVLAIWATFWHVLSADFVHLDDKVLVTENLKIRALSWVNIWGYFSSYHEHLYHPLVSLSFGLEYSFAGLNPQVYHATNLILHTINALLMFGLFFILMDSPLIAFGTALLFAIHPLHVEPVAWVSGRKDTLYALFFLGSLLSYAKYIIGRNLKEYFLAFSLFCCALLSKSMAISLPVVIPTLYWMAGRNIQREDLFRLIPFFVMSIIFSVITVTGYYEVQTVANSPLSGFWGNLYNACQNYLFYMIKFCYPDKLSAMYPRPTDLGNIPARLFEWAPVILVSIPLGLYVLRSRSLPLIAGLSFFVITIAPVSQVIPVGVGGPADRYTYIPYAGLAFLVMLALSKIVKLSGVKPWKILPTVLLVAMAIPLSIVARQKTLVWQNTITLSEDMLRYYELPSQYYSNGGAELLVNMEPAIAMKYFSKAIKIEPGNKAGWYHRGIVQLKSGNFEEAIADFHEAIKLDHRFIAAYVNRSRAYHGLGKNKLADMDLKRAQVLGSSEVR